MDSQTDIVLWKRCSKCGQLKSGDDFYKYKDKTSADECKECLTAGIDNFKPETFLWLMEKFDIPYIETDWNALRDRACQKDPKKTGGMSIFGKYLSQMKLTARRGLKWKDTERIPRKWTEEELRDLQKKFEQVFWEEGNK